MKVEYKVYNPSGNITALVIGDNYSLNERKIINNKIMKTNSKIEQVGFVSTTEYRLTMAGGEFCGNAIRCAIMYYKIKNETIFINDQQINGGISENKKVWCEIPIKKYKTTKLNENINKVELDGITMLIISRKLSKEYLNKDLKVIAKNIIKLYSLQNNEAVGVIFLEENDNLKIYPVVWVKVINTLFLENACGSGTIATAIVENMVIGKKHKYCILQSSGEFLETNIIIKNKIVKKAKLTGEIYTNNKINIIII